MTDTENQTAAGPVPQKFRLLDTVRVRQGEGAPEWASDWAGIILQVSGVRIDPRRPNRVEYYVREPGKRPEDPMVEDWLEACAND